MADYKDTLLKHLSDAGWEQTEAMPTTQWWGSEVWRVRSTTINWGFELFLTFMDDPYPRDTSGGDTVWTVKLTDEDPCEIAETPTLGSIPTKQKDLERELPGFLDVMDGLRRDEHRKENDAGQAGDDQPSTAPDP